MTLNVIGRKKLYLTLSGVLIGLSLLSIGTFGFRQGIDFTGGTLWQLSFPSGTPPTQAELAATFEKEFNIADARITFDPGSKSFFARFHPVEESDHQRFLETLSQVYPGATELSFQSIGPSVSGEVRRKAITAIALVLVGISLYIAFAFRKVSRPISSWNYGWITLLTLFHDVVIPAGLLAVLGRYFGVEIDSNFVVALLVVMGFSVHDTIVVFDRIRENLLLDRGKAPFEDTVNRSVNQTLARSVNTSLTLILVLLALYFTGPINLRYFILTLLVGVTVGIYSSVFFASPVLTIRNSFRDKKR
jgi:preprotein translocase subunit SecF